MLERAFLPIKHSSQTYLPKRMYHGNHEQDVVVAGTVHQSSRSYTPKQYTISSESKKYNKRLYGAHWSLSDIKNEQLSISMKNPNSKFLLYSKEFSLKSHLQILNVTSYTENYYIFLECNVTSLCYNLQVY